MGKDVMIKALFKESSIYAIPTVLASLVGFFMLPVYTRVLTPADYGLLETVTKITDIFGLFLGAGIADAVVRFYSGAENQEQKNSIVVTAVSMVTLFSLAGGLMFTSISKQLANYFLNSDNPQLLLISFSSVAVGLLLRISLSVYQCESRAWQFAGVSIGMLVTQITFNVLALFVYKLGVFGIIVSSLIATSLWSIITIIPIYFKKLGSINRDWFNRLSSYGLPLVFASLAQFILNFSDRFFLAKSTSMSSLGVYSVAYRVGMLVTMVLAVFGRSWWPLVFKIATQPHAEINLRRMNALMSFVSAWVCVGVILLAKPVIILMTTLQFRDAYLLVPPIAIAYLIFCLVNGPLSVSFKIRNKTQIIAKFNIISAVFCLVLSIIIIPKYGTLGAVIVTLLSYIIQLIPACLWSYRCWPIIFDLKPILLALVGVIIAAIISYIPSYEWYIDLLFRMFTISILGASYAYIWLSRYKVSSL